MMLAAVAAQAQITINIRYHAPGDSALLYMQEMEATGLADSIRAIRGCLRYDYFIPQDDPKSVLLIDSWENQEALNRYHSSNVMKEAEALRAKYKIERKAEIFAPAMPPARANAQDERLRALEEENAALRAEIERLQAKKRRK